jgi:hypothetical protein
MALHVGEGGGGLLDITFNWPVPETPMWNGV